MAMSGGVDSSVAAYLLARAGYEVVGITMRLYTDERGDLPPLNRRCCTTDDVDDAKRVCQVLGIPHYTLNFESDFKNSVIDYFVAEYSRGRTPHPCIACNQKVKFAPLMSKALMFGADYLATGHYAQVQHDNGTFRLLKAVDPSKDQSYVLYHLGQKELSRTLFPVGQYSKHHIREIAREARLPVADKADSQEICFIPVGGYRKFVAERVSPVSGEIVDTSGKLLGYHTGIESFTVGQRHGLGIDSKKPLYVIDLDPNTHQVVVGPGEKLLSQWLLAERVSYVGGTPTLGPVEITAKIRYKSPEAQAILFPKGSQAEVEFLTPQRAITPGQAVVFYRGEELIGGGVIARLERAPLGAINQTATERVEGESKTRLTRPYGSTGSP